jgi:hypothetical protein
VALGLRQPTSRRHSPWAQTNARNSSSCHARVPRRVASSICGSAPNFGGQDRDPDQDTTMDCIVVVAVLSGCTRPPACGRHGDPLRLLRGPHARGRSRSRAMTHRLSHRETTTCRLQPRAPRSARRIVPCLVGVRTPPLHYLRRCTEHTRPVYPSSPIHPFPHYLAPSAPVQYRPSPPIKIIVAASSTRLTSTPAHSKRHFVLASATAVSPNPWSNSQRRPYSPLKGAGAVRHGAIGRLIHPKGT